MQWRPLQVAGGFLAVATPLTLIGLHLLEAPISLFAAIGGVFAALSLAVHLHAAKLTKTEDSAATVSGQAVAHENEIAFRLQQIERIKNDFVSSVSHELRTPLTSTLGYLELLADGDAGELMPEQSRMVEIATRNSKRLQLLIEDLLTLSRIESGSYRLRFQPVDIAAAVKAAVQRSNAAAGERNIDMLFAISDDLGTCAGEEGQLVQAIDNVVNNAVKFTTPGGSVNVQVHNTGGNVTIRVQDSGIGIPTHEQSMLFDRFFRASIAVEQAHHGTGLGLTIAKTIIEHHGGTIALESTAGVGTAVTMVLPSMPAGISSTTSAPKPRRLGPDSQPRLKNPLA